MQKSTSGTRVTHSPHPDPLPEGEGDGLVLGKWLLVAVLTTWPAFSLADCPPEVVGTPCTLQPCGHPGTWRCVGNPLHNPHLACDAAPCCQLGDSCLLGNGCPGVVTECGAQEICSCNGAASTYCPASDGCAGTMACD